ncbi:hypothetical protein DFS34DRAFT_590360 [Phlyctochytrium arcticum]|nr:hypothetical protein DFS34DRAFT_590360 [Phlyctochytrium arcticum]
MGSNTNHATRRESNITTDPNQRTERASCKHCEFSCAFNMSRMRAHLAACTAYQASDAAQRALLAPQTENVISKSIPSSSRIMNYVHKLTPEENEKLQEKLSLAIFAGKTTSNITIIHKSLQDEAVTSNAWAPWQKIPILKGPTPLSCSSFLLLHHELNRKKLNSFSTLSRIQPLQMTDEIAHHKRAMEIVASHQDGRIDERIAAFEKIATLIPKDKLPLFRDRLQLPDTASQDDTNDKEQYFSTDDSLPGQGSKDPPARSLVDSLGPAAPGRDAQVPTDLQAFVDEIRRAMPRAANKRRQASDDKGNDEPNEPLAKRRSYLFPPMLTDSRNLDKPVDPLQAEIALTAREFIENKKGWASALDQACRDLRVPTLAYWLIHTNKFVPAGCCEAPQDGEYNAVNCIAAGKFPKLDTVPVTDYYSYIEFIRVVREAHAAGMHVVCGVDAARRCRVMWTNYLDYMAGKWAYLCKNCPDNTLRHFLCYEKAFRQAYHNNHFCTLGDTAFLESHAASYLIGSLVEDPAPLRFDRTLGETTVERREKRGKFDCGGDNVCHGFNTGRCPFGDKCHYSHECELCHGQHPILDCPTSPRRGSSPPPRGPPPQPATTPPTAPR